MTDKSRQPGRAAFAFQSAFDDFDLEQIVGEGGMSTVWRARHRHTGAPVALKILRTDATTDVSWVTRFQREARAMAALRHPNIGRVLAFGEGPRGLFIAFELLEGGTLRELKAAMGGTLPVPVAIEVMAQLLDALEYAHAAGVIHRDIKPANVMLTAGGVLKLVDFGIARGEDDLHITTTGAVIGTPAFMSPEQAEGDPTDERSDLFATGIVLSDLVTGKSPFSADSTAATLMRVLREEVPLLSEGAGGVPWLLDRLHGRLVDRERERRPVGADFALEELQPLAEGVRARWPRLLSDVVARPAEMSRVLRRELADDEVRHAEEIVKKHGPHPGAVLALVEAVRIDASHDEAARRLTAAAGDAGVVLRPGPDDDALQEVLAGLGVQPRNAALWKRLAALRCARRETFAEAIALKRLLRLRHDEDAERRVAELTLGPEAPPVAGGRAESAHDRHDKTTASVAQRRRRVAAGSAAAALLAVATLLVGAVIGSMVKGWSDSKQQARPDQEAVEACLKECLTTGAPVGPPAPRAAPQFRSP